MAQPTRARQDLRLDVLKKLDPVSEPKSSSCTSDSDSLTVLKDTLLAPGAESEDYVGDWIYVRSQPTAVASGSTVVGAHNTTVTTLAVDDGTDFTVGDGIQVTVSSVTETMRVTVIASNNLTVVRGIQGSTAVSMSGGETVNIVGPAIGEIARVTAVGFSGTNSQLTTAPDFSASLVDTQEYERHRKVRPNIINDRLDVILGLLRQNVLLPITLVTDGDMEDTTATPPNYTAAGTVGTPTLAKNTTFVRRGRQSLSITNDGSTTVGYAKSDSMFLPGGTECIVEADVYITAGDLAKLTFYDVTNSAVIGTAMESDESGWVHLENLFTVPATCEEVQVWAESQAASDVTYWDHITVWPTRDQGIDLPSFLEFIYDVKSLFFLPVGMGLTGSTNVSAYRINESTPQLYAHYQRERDDTGVVSARFYVESRKPPNALWLKGRKPYPVFSGATDALKDVDTTQAHKNVVANMTAASIIDDLNLDATEAEKFELAGKLGERALLLRHEIQHILANMTPPKTKTITTPFTRKRI
ncbi:hypothetical protein LCGC14_2052980 [marine sediment metagenome]|uniref:Uncharacterized protein n=1 Tax=marine sediment metagenome TaxID=412755 RepID=A0A0F9H1W0_9ZZZZ